ncbi:MAG: pyridoxal phosphate-dependent aminotransferase [Albidovulum sp.]|nr:pyridoxal phosphate-dependent aminotransferase [Albidovulum sp.]
MPRFTELVAGLPATVPFVGPEAQERTRGKSFKARIGANENVFGPSPRAVEAMAREAAETWQYGDPENHELKIALALLHGIAVENVVVGEGIDGLLGYLVRMLIEPGDKVVTSLGAYPTFNFHVAGFGGDLETVPYKDDHEDVFALIAKAAEVRAKIVYLANPDNPMGTIHPPSTIGRAIDTIPGNCILVLDEAYLDCAPAGSEYPLDPKDTRIVRMRTFSKVYGMAGARVGYAIGHQELIRSFDKIRNHFGMSRISQAGALAALEDRQHLANTVARIENARRRIGEIAASNGLSVVPSAANFVAVDCGRDGVYARRVLEGLIKRDIFVRMPFVPPQDRCIRVSAGTESDLRLFEQALPAALRDA